VDSSAWIGILHARDQYNAPARRFFQTLNRSVLTTSNYVLSETLTWFAQNRLHDLSHQLRGIIDAGRQAAALRLLWVDESIHNRAWDLFELNPGQRLSFCDCTTAVLCRGHSVDFVFTFDSDFRAMGFDVRP
jgi:predicted nucleic acid-binding protein